MRINPTDLVEYFRVASNGQYSTVDGGENVLVPNGRDRFTLEGNDVMGVNEDRNYVIKLSERQTGPHKQLDVHVDTYMFDMLGEGTRLDARVADFSIDEETTKLAGLSGDVKFVDGYLVMEHRISDHQRLPSSAPTSRPTSELTNNNPAKPPEKEDWRAWNWSVHR